MLKFFFLFVDAGEMDNFMACNPITRERGQLPCHSNLELESFKCPWKSSSPCSTLQIMCPIFHLGKCFVVYSEAKIQGILNIWLRFSWVSGFCLRSGKKLLNIKRDIIDGTRTKIYVRNSIKNSLPSNLTWVWDFVV